MITYIHINMYTWSKIRCISTVLRPHINPQVYPLLELWQCISRAYNLTDGKYHICVTLFNMSFTYWELIEWNTCCPIMPRSCQPDKLSNILQSMLSRTSGWTWSPCRYGNKLNNVLFFIWRCSMSIQQTLKVSKSCKLL